MKVHEGTQLLALVSVTVNIARLRHGRLARKGSVVCFHDVLVTAVIEGAGGMDFFRLFFLHFDALFLLTHWQT